MKTGSTTKQIAKFYDQHANTYLQAGELVIQVMRPDDENAFLEYLMRQIGIGDGMRLLDGGCGIGGPAIYFAKQKNIEIECVTISEAEARIARERAAEAGATKVHVSVRDYHELAEAYPAASFDGVIFLESLGHAARPIDVLKGVHHILKPGGFLYIKDFFRRPPRDDNERPALNSMVAKLNSAYCYNTTTLDSLIELLRSRHFKIKTIARPAFAASQYYLQSFHDLFGATAQDEPVLWHEIMCVK
jgi:cyclopropane fatty-acyl-phospholipid synthase-like methyltransferase